MNFKTIVNLGMLAGVFIITSCGQTDNIQDNTDINSLTEIEDQAFQQEVGEEEGKLEDYIKDLNSKIEIANAEDAEILKETKEQAVNMLLELRSDYLKLTEESAAKWVVFQSNVKNLINTSSEEINYAQEIEDDNSDI